MEIIPRTICDLSSPLTFALTPHSFSDWRRILSPTSLNVVIVSWSTSAWLGLLSWHMVSVVPVFVLARRAATHPSTTTTMLSARLLWVSNPLLYIYFSFELLLRFGLRLNLHVIVIKFVGAGSSTALSTSPSPNFIISRLLSFNLFSWLKFSNFSWLFVLLLCRLLL